MEFFVLTLGCNIRAATYDSDTAGNDQTWLASIDTRSDPQRENLCWRASGHHYAVISPAAHLQLQLPNEAVHRCPEEPDSAEEISNSKSVSSREFLVPCRDTAESPAFGDALACSDPRSHFTCLLFGCQIHCSLCWASRCQTSFLEQKGGFACSFAPSWNHARRTGCSLEAEPNFDCMLAAVRKPASESAGTACCYRVRVWWIICLAASEESERRAVVAPGQPRAGSVASFRAGSSDLQAHQD